MSGDMNLSLIHGLEKVESPTGSKVQQRTNINYPEQHDGRLKCCVY